MPLVPKIPKNLNALKTKKCPGCGAVLSFSDFAETRSIFYPDGTLPVCNSCINDYLRAADWNWDRIDQVCRWADIPFVVKEWERLVELNGLENTWAVYCRVFHDQEYEGIGWKDYYKQYKDLREAGEIEGEIPLLDEAKVKQLQKKWGSNYDEEELYYLEDLYKGLVTTQNVNGALQVDQAQKICKLSLEIDSRIRAGDKDVDKFLSSYDKLVKTAEFTPKNTKNAADFDSFAEVAMWLEKRGRQNTFYDNVTRDVVDESLKNIENYNQKLYLNEGGIGEEITERISLLKQANNLEKESIFGIQKEYNLDEYDNAGYIPEEEDFNPEGEEDD